MSFIALLWLPILVSAVVMFLVSFATHMLLPWRRKEWRHVPDYAAVQSAVRDLPPGLYAFPAAADPKEQMSKEWMERWAAGPSGWLTIVPKGAVSMGRNMTLTFLVFLAVAFLTAYVAAHALPPAPHYLAVFRVVGTVGILAFLGSAPFASIWYSRPWTSFAADALDAILFGLTMAGVFGWLWPR